jgi:hypothetical protein
MERHPRCEAYMSTLVVHILELWKGCLTISLQKPRTFRVTIDRHKQRGYMSIAIPVSKPIAPFPGQSSLEWKRFSSRLEMFLVVSSMTIHIFVGKWHARLI